MASALFTTEKGYVYKKYLPDDYNQVQMIGYIAQWISAEGISFEQGVVVVIDKSHKFMGQFAITQGGGYLSTVDALDRETAIAIKMLLW